MGAVIMKITSSRSITSIRLTTLISELSGRPSRRRRGMLQAALASEHRDQRRAEPLEYVVESIETIGEDVVAEGGGDRHAERGGRRHERLGDAGRHRGEIARSARRDADERADD